MRKFKLIKEYPGSQELGFEIRFPFQDGMNNPASYHNHHWFDPNNYKDHWQEVIEKDYEILSFYDGPKHSYIFKLCSNGKYTTSKQDLGTISAFELLEHVDTRWKIYSIKRLSDGEIFTIGDKTTSGTIEQMLFSKNRTTIWIDMGDLCYGGYFTVNDLQKIKQPLFKTEDGVDIFNGINFWNVTLFYMLNEFQVTNDEYPLKFIADGSKQFSTKELAEVYILMNKPCLSLNEIIQAYKDSKLNTPLSRKFIKELKETINTKING